MGPVDEEASLGLRPLTARSVVLSMLLGTHPPRLPVRSLVRVGQLFGVSEGSLRVTLSRMAAAGDVRVDGGVYELSGRLLIRQRTQDEARDPGVRAWRGRWEMAVCEDTAAAAELGAVLRMGQLRPGVWLRPANLRRSWPDASCRRFDVRPAEDPVLLAARLWDLDGWATEARALLAAMGAEAEPARIFTVSAAVVRLLRRDPLLPAELLPEDWPGAELRRTYGDYEETLVALLTGSPEASARHRET